MNKNIKEDIVITNGDVELFKKSLNEGKVVLLAIELGKFIKQSLEKGYSDYFQAYVKLKEVTNQGICFCGKPATHLVYY